MHAVFVEYEPGICHDTLTIIFNFVLYFEMAAYEFWVTAADSFFVKFICIPAFYFKANCHVFFSMDV